MSLDEFIFKGDSGFIGEEFLQDNEFHRRALMVQRTVKEGDFKLSEALKAYDLSASTYYNFIRYTFVSDLKNTTASIESDKSKYLIIIELIAELYRDLAPVDHDSSIIFDHLSQLKNDIEERKIAS